MALTHKLSKLAKQVDDLANKVDKLRVLYEQAIADLKAKQTGQVARRVNRRNETQE